MTNRNSALGNWHKGVSTYTKQHYGPPHGAREWVEFGGARLPTAGILHRTGSPDVKVEVLSSAGCSMLSSGQKICTVFARPMGPMDLIRYRLPTGGQGRATSHRLYETPSGRPTTNPGVIQSRRIVKKAWLPASYTGEKPGGLRGSWVQISSDGPGIGTIHAPGIGAQQAQVLQVKTDGAGRLRALVRWRQSPNPNGFRRTNAGVRVTTTIQHPDKWWCRLLPGAKGCVAQKITPATNPCKCDPPCARSLNPEAVSAAASRAQMNRGSGVLDALRSGTARVVLDKTGVKLVAA